MNIYVCELRKSILKTLDLLDLHVIFINSVQKLKCGRNIFHWAVLQYIYVLGQYDNVEVFLPKRLDNFNAIFRTL